MSLLQNAIGSFTLRRALVPNDSESTAPFIDAQLARKTAPLNLVTPLVRKPKPGLFSRDAYHIAPPPRPPSTLPLPGDAQLTGTLGEFIGDGRTGIVFELNDIRVDGEPTSALPALVVKIARANRVASLAREAWFYDDMESLQGMAIPRCYGWFEADLVGHTVPAWTDHLAMDRDDYDVTLDIDKPHSSNGFVHPDLLERGQRRNLLSVLVLERLGGNMPVLQPVDESDKRDLLAIYAEIGHLGIQVCEDIRWQNVLAAPDREPHLPSLPSPTLGHPHKWRAIDFELATKTNYGRALLRMNYEQYVSKMMRWIEYEGPATYEENELEFQRAWNSRSRRKPEEEPEDEEGEEENA